jgi:hypothetical protein
MRKTDLDWLRVIIFGLLIFYHVGMFFVPWGFHIKNNVIYEWTTWPMLFLNQWRLPMLFVISGVGTWYALGKRTWLQFSAERIKRLLLPLVFGMLVIVPPQVYIERLTFGQFHGSYFEFWPAHAFNGAYPTGNLSWHHLWFLPYLLVYSLLMIPLFMYLKRTLDNPYFSTLKTWIGRLSPKLLWFLLPFYLTYTLLKEFFPVTHDLVNDWFTLVNYLLFFIMGFSMAGVGAPVWDAVEKYRGRILIGAMVSFTLYILLEKLVAHTVTMHFIRNSFKVVNIWLWILVCFGYAAKYLNTENKVLHYANAAVYPFYILHQSVMMVFAYWLMNKSWGFWTKASLLVLLTFGVTWLIYEVGIRRWRWIRPFFGIKESTSQGRGIKQKEIGTLP